MVERPEKPLLAAKASRSRACSPMATATRGFVDDAVEMIPKGMLAREKCEPRGMLNQDRSEAMARRVVIVCGIAWYGVALGS